MPVEKRHLILVRDYEAERRTRFGRLYWLISLVDVVCRKLLPGRLEKQISRQLSAGEASGMTVNERLLVSGQNDAYECAAATGDESTMVGILEEVHLMPDDIQRILALYRRTGKISR
jgi:hypothetical protein